MFKKLRDKIRRRSRQRLDAKAARAEGYSQGSEDTSNELMRQIRSQNSRITHLTAENLKIEENLRLHYEERTNLLETRYTEKCNQCMTTTDAERERLRKNQNMILDLIQTFNVVFVKVYKHTNLITDEHDNIIKSSGRVKASRETLLCIKNEADKIMQKVEPLVSIHLTENDQEHSVEFQLPTANNYDKSKNKIKDKSNKQH